MSRLFTPVKFPEPAKEKPAPTPKETPFPDIKEELKEVDAEISRAQDGSSTIIRHAIQFPKGKSPVLTRLKALRDEPSMDNLRLFMQLAQQDLGLAHARYFASLFRAKVPEVDKFHG